MKNRRLYMLCLFTISLAGCSGGTPPTGEPTTEPTEQADTTEGAVTDTAAAPAPTADAEAPQTRSLSAEETRAERQAFTAFLEQVKLCEVSSTTLTTVGEMAGVSISGEDVFEVLGGTPDACRLRIGVRLSSLDMPDDRAEALLAMGQGTPGHPHTKEELLERMREQAERSRLCVGPASELAERYALYHLGVQTGPLDDQLCEVEGSDCGAAPHLAAHCALTECRNGSWYAECRENSGETSRCMLGRGATPEGYEEFCVGTMSGTRPIETRP